MADGRISTWHTCLTIIHSATSHLALNTFHLEGQLDETSHLALNTFDLEEQLDIHSAYLPCTHASLSFIQQRLTLH